MTEADLRAGPGALASIGLCFGLVTGLLEVAIQLVRQQMLNRILYVGDAFVWETPVVYGALFLGLAAAIGLVWLVVRNDRARLGVAVFAFAFVSAWSLLLLFPRIHELAAAVLAAGIASRASSIAASGGSVLQRVVRRTLPGAAVLGLVLAGVWLAARRDESRPATTATAREGAPNILLIILDTVRASELGAYGYERPTTPRIDRLAASGALFEAAFSTTSWTLPSHASMFTGRDASALRTNWRTPLEPGVRTLAESLAASGYRTAGFTANLWYTSRATHLNRGFRHYEDYEFTIEQFFKSSSIGQFASRHWPGHSHRRARVHRWINDRKNAADVRAHFLRWLEENDGGSAPFFAFLNFFDAHQPYWAPAEYRNRFRKADRSRDRYDAAIAYIDDQVGLILDGLAARGLLDSTIVIITADHGEQFGEHGLGGHGNSLYRAVLHVPLIVHGVRGMTGRRVERPVSLRDLPATIAQLAGVTDAGLPGRSLVPVLSGARVETSPVRAHLGKGVRTPPSEPVSRGEMFSIIAGPLHYILNGDGVEELYDLDADPEELRDLAAERSWRSRLDEVRALLPATAPRR